MNLRKSILFRQAIAAMMLLVLFFVNTIQLSHTHTGKGDVTSRQKSLLQNQGTKQLYSNVTDTKCFICDYQLAKDADLSIVSFRFSVPLFFVASAAPFVNSSPQQQYSYFETRGPPAIC